MFEREIKYYPLFKSQTAGKSAIYSAPVDTRDFKCAQITTTGSNTASFTIKFQASLQKNPPDFTSAPTTLNQWQYVQVVDLDTGNTINGATGYTFASDVTKQFELNTNGIAWMCLELGAGSGTLDANVTITSGI